MKTISTKGFITVIKRLIDDDYSASCYGVEDEHTLDEYIDQRIDIAIKRLLTMLLAEEYNAVYPEGNPK